MPPQKNRVSRLPVLSYRDSIEAPFFPSSGWQQRFYPKGDFLSRSSTFATHNSLAFILLLTVGLLFTPACTQDMKSELPDDVELSKIKGVSIVQCASPDGHWTIGEDSASKTAETVAAPLEEVIRRWCPVEGRLVIDAKLPAGLYNIRIEAEPGQSFWSLAEQAFREVFGLRFVQCTEEIDVLVLKQQANIPPELARVDAESSDWGTASTDCGFGYDVRAGTMKDLVDIVSKYFDGPVLDETGLTGFYKFTLAMDHWEPQTVFPAVEQLGLKLHKAKRQLSVMHVVSVSAKQR